MGKAAGARECTDSSPRTRLQVGLLALSTVVNQLKELTAALGLGLRLCSFSYLSLPLTALKFLQTLSGLESSGHLE